MTHKKTVFGIAVATSAVAVLGIGLGAARHFASIDQTRASHSVSAPEIVELPKPGLSRVRLFVANPN
jgi:hypothetical protein